MNLEESKEVLGVVVSILAIPISLFTIIKFVKDYNNWFGVSRLESQIEILKDQRRTTKDKLLKKHAKRLIKELEFKIIANCDYTKKNKLLFEYCMSNESWLSWKKCQRIKQFFISENNDSLKIKYGLGHKVFLWFTLIYLLFCVLFMMFLAIVVLFVDKTYLGIIGFFIITCLTMPLIVFAGRTWREHYLVRLIISKGDILLAKK
jgi:ABC-type multidrug transport system fused ATPase/permease subunit